MLLYSSEPNYEISGKMNLNKFQVHADNITTMELHLCTAVN